MITNHNNRQAFTLLEIMLAVTILGLVMASVYGSWTAALSGWRRTSEVSDTFQRQRVVMDMLSELTRSAVFFGSNPELYQVIGTHDTSHGDSVSFVTASDALLPPGEALLAGMRRVTIGLDRAAQGGVALTLANSAALGDTGDTQSAPPSHVISAEVVGFGVRYRDSRDGQWKESWEDAIVVPMAMEFTVAFADPSNPKAAPLTVTRAVEMPAAIGAMQLAGQRMPEGTTNGVTKQDVPTVDVDKVKSETEGM